MPNAHRFIGTSDYNPPSNSLEVSTPRGLGQTAAVDVAVIGPSGARSPVRLGTDYLPRIVQTLLECAQRTGDPRYDRPLARLAAEAHIVAMELELMRHPDHSLEAEALALLNAIREERHDDLLEELPAHSRDLWLAVARKARALREEADGA